jgi:hypothetical protein
MEINERVKQYLAEGKTQREAIELAYNSYYKETPRMQQGGTSGSKSWDEQLERVRKEKANKPFPKLTVVDLIAEKKLRDQNIGRELPPQMVRDNTGVNINNKPELVSKVARNKTDKEIAEIRKYKIDQSIKAQKNSYTSNNWRQQLAAETNATGDKFRVSNEPNFFDDYLNPAVMIGSMASNLGQAPLQAQQQDSYMPYITSIGTPLAVGALAGIGTNSTGQFVNNLANPLAGTGDLVNNLGNKYLPNAYKLNPNAFKTNPKAYYRTLGKKGVEDAFGSGVIRPKQTSNIYSPELGKRVDVNVPAFPEGSYFNKGSLYSNKKMYNPDYIAEVVEKDNLFVNPERIVFNENIRVAPNNIPIEEANFYKKDWLKGYKQVEVSKTTQAEEMADLYRIQNKDAKTFKQQAEDGTLHRFFNNPKTLEKKANEEKYFGQWFTNDKQDLDWYLRDREFNNPEYLHLQVPKKDLDNYNIKNFDSELSRAPEREFILPQNLIDRAKKYDNINQFQQGGTQYTDNELAFIYELNNLSF